MYDLRFVATSSAGWAQAIELIDTTTNLPFDTTGMTFELDVRDSGNCQMLEASSSNGRIERPTDSVIQWRFTADEMRRFCKGTTYQVGCTATDDGGTIQLFIGSLAMLDGEVS